MELSKTQSFSRDKGTKITAADILSHVYSSLHEKGYDPVNQIVGYIMSGDPTFITAYNGARVLISKVERDELVEEMLKTYISAHNWE
jgi:uncharacterized protein (UPF0297 family)